MRAPPRQSTRKYAPTSPTQAPATRFSGDTFKFIEKASRQKKPDWLDRNRDEYEQHLLNPLKHLASHLKAKLAPIAPNYHFPLKGIGRMKRPAHRALEYGSLYRDYVAYSVSRPSESRFDSNPNLFFLIHPGDEDGDRVLVAGGLYMPSSRQLRSVREAIAQNATPFDKLFAHKAFATRFSEGFSDERKSTRAPRGFDPSHPRMEWLQLQAYFVWHPYTLREFSSSGFADLVATDWTQIVRLNQLLDAAIQGRWNSITSSDPGQTKKKEARVVPLTSRLEEIELPRRKMDF